MARILSTIKATDIESLYDAFKKTLVTVQHRSFYGVAVDPQTIPQVPDYNQGQLGSCKIHLLDTDDVVLLFFDLVYKTDHLLVVI